MKYRKLGKTGWDVSAIGYGGVVSSKHFDRAVIPGDGQKMSDEYVGWAIENGINYFDVAPGYGDAQLLMGNSLKPYRNDVYLACKTAFRERKEAEQDMLNSLQLLHTDYFDVYQLHGVATMEELERCFAPGGTMELLRDMKEKGIARKIGITAHSESAAVGALELYDFDTVMFPLNWHMNMEHGMGERIRKAVKDNGQGLLGIKSMVDRAWSNEEQDSSIYPKSWCRPFYIETESDYLIAALKYSVSLGADILIPPGNFEHLKFAVNHIDEVLDNPLTEEDRAFLAARLPQVREEPFYDPECYQL